MSTPKLLIGQTTDERDTLLQMLNERDQQITNLSRQLRDVRSEREEMSEELQQLRRSMSLLRTLLGPLYNALRTIFNELPEDTGEADPSAIAAPSNERVKAIWDSWKMKLGEGPAKLIDALMLHGEMNTQQLSIATGYHRTTIPGYIFRLNKAGLINKNGGRFSLKQL